jgi:hypothetical protein
VGHSGSTRHEVSNRDGVDLITEAPLDSIEQRVARCTMPGSPRSHRVAIEDVARDVSSVCFDLFWRSID